MDANDVMKLYGNHVNRARKFNVTVTDEDLIKYSELCEKYGYRGAADITDIRVDLLRQYTTRARKKGLI